MGKTVQHDLDDIFNIPRDGSNVKNEDDSQEGAYAAVLNSNSTAPFSDKAEVLAQKIAPAVAPQDQIEYVSQPPKVEQKPNVASAPKIETVVPLPEGSKNDQRQQSSPERILSEAIPGKDNERRPNPQVEVKPIAHTADGDGADDGEDEPEVRTEHECDSGSDQSATGTQIAVENEDGWLLESPAPKYNQFYAEKKWILPRILRGGKIPVDKFRKELSEAYVDTKVEMYDYELISQKMTEIRNWQTRVLQMRGHVLVQFYNWKRTVELFHGVLARAEYAKPAICQQGVIYNHMRDMEMYLADLQYLHDFTKELGANLVSQFESMSRQVTLSMPLRSVERTEAPQQVPLPPPVSVPDTPKPVAKKSDLSGYDRLENGVNSKEFSPQKSKNISTSSESSDAAPKKKIDWSDIG